ncbi:transcription intermediary factor 1-alpha-like, partial [Ruditapes philippinarum]|uniref:transcription intermediary factor 1-alpha-like n=1 Tax=Ruditapes philippinarum TaxID=129788 RepID=UPI00295A94D3
IFMAVPGKKASQKFSTTISQGGAEDFDIFCEICDRDDIRLPSFGYCVDCEEHLCHTCFSNHLRPKPSRHHQLLDKEHMPQKQNLHKSSKSAPSALADDLTKPCTKHTKEVIKFYCHDHNALICSVCVTLEHTPTSCHVDYIPDISGQIVDSSELKKTLKDINTLTDKCSQISKDLQQRVALSTTSLQDALTEIEKFRKEINHRLDELKKNVRDTAATIQSDNNDKLKTTETTCDVINKSLQASADTLKHLNSHKKTDQLFVELKIAQQLIQNNEKTTSQLPTVNDFDVYIFEPNQAIKNVVQDEKSLGILSNKKLEQPAKPKNQFAVAMKMSSPRNINAKTSSDKRTCYITGLTVSSPNKIFAADHLNKSVKMIDIINGVITQLQLDLYPWDVTIVSGDSLAVTIPQSETIQFISFSHDSLSLKNKLTVDGQCNGISYHQGKMAVTFKCPAKLQIMDLKGNTEITVDTDFSGGSIFRVARFVTTNYDSIYVSDNGKAMIARFNWQGQLMERRAGISSLMEVENKLYRREQLIEELVGSIKDKDPDFNIQNDQKP